MENKYGWNKLMRMTKAQLIEEAQKLGSKDCAIATRSKASLADTVIWLADRAVLNFWADWANGILRINNRTGKVTFEDAYDTYRWDSVEAAAADALVAIREWAKDEPEALAFLLDQDIDPMLTDEEKDNYPICEDDAKELAEYYADVNDGEAVFNADGTLTVITDGGEELSYPDAASFARSVLFSEETIGWFRG